MYINYFMQMPVQSIAISSTHFLQMVELPSIVGKVQDLRLLPVTLKKKKKGGEKWEII